MNLVFWAMVHHYSRTIAVCQPSSAIKADALSALQGEDIEIVEDIDGLAAARCAEVL
jgi:hypothetical protein